jgi:hypothetical protein
MLIIKVDLSYLCMLSIGCNLIMLINLTCLIAGLKVISNRY